MTNTSRGHNGLGPGPDLERAPASPPAVAERFQTAFGQPRNSLNNRFVYAVISQRARGLSVGVNLNPDNHCNFDCAYCEVHRDTPGHDRTVDIGVMIDELERVLHQAHDGGLRQLPGFSHLPADVTHKMTCENAGKFYGLIN